MVVFAPRLTIPARPDGRVAAASITTRPRSDAPDRHCIGRRRQRCGSTGAPAQTRRRQPGHRQQHTKDCGYQAGQPTVRLPA